jgi:transposase-like protein
MCNLTAPFFNDEDAARTYLEGQRWPEGPVCPHCGGSERIYPVKAKGKVRKGLYHCNDCEKQFTVTVGTVFERSKVPLHKWLLATYLLCSSKKGISAKQIERTIGVTYKTAWFMCHRIREAMREGHTGLWNDPGKMGGNGSTVEADETYIGRRRPRKGETLPSGYGHKEKVITLVERGGRSRSFHVPAVNAETLRTVLTQEIHPNTKIYTDDSGLYRQMKKFFKSHDSVNHTLKEYVRGDVHTNTIENYFSVLKRGLNGVYQHCSKQHLKRYLGEYDFRYNHREKLGYDDLARTNIALKGIEGKRLLYRD